MAGRVPGTCFASAFQHQTGGIHFQACKIPEPTGKIENLLCRLSLKIDQTAETGGTMVATMEVPLEKTKSYGVLDVAEDMGAIVKAKGLVEKPKDNPPSNLAVIGRYILAPTVLQNLNKLREGAGGEIQLTDAIADEITEGREVFGLRFRGQRYDCGSKAGFLQATVAFGLERDELREEFLDYLNEVVSMQRAAE